MIKLLATAALLPALIGTAHAGAWLPSPGQDSEAPRAIYTETDGGTALLTCNGEGQFTAMLSQVTENFPETMKKPAPYRRGADVQLTTPERESEAKWVIVPAIDTIISVSHVNAARIYNTAVRGEPLNVKVDGKDFVSLELPEIDDSFKAFAKTCRS
ncbi:MAG: hypothetical protein AAGK66_06475 [Pseudomonadota bacterium]